MSPLESLLCPCCTPALLHSLAQTNPELWPSQMLMVGKGAFLAAISKKLEPKPQNT